MKRERWDWQAKLWFCSPLYQLFRLSRALVFFAGEVLRAKAAEAMPDVMIVNSESFPQRIVKRNWVYRNAFQFQR